MTEIQEFFTRLVYNISLIIPLGYAFGAGMVSTVNPCGFAMLPAYLGLYLGSRNLNAVAPAGASYTDSATASGSVRSQLTKAVLVSLVITGGFLLLFGAAGVVISAGGQLIGTFAPWVALAIGGLLLKRCPINASEVDGHLQFETRPWQDPLEYTLWGDCYHNFRRGVPENGLQIGTKNKISNLNETPYGFRGDRIIISGHMVRKINLIWGIPGKRFYGWGMVGGHLSPICSATGPTADELQGIGRSRPAA